MRNQESRIRSHIQRSEKHSVGFDGSRTGGAGQTTSRLQAPDAFSPAPRGDHGWRGCVLKYSECGEHHENAAAARRLRQELGEARPDLCKLPLQPDLSGQTRGCSCSAVRLHDRSSSSASLHCWQCSGDLDLLPRGAGEDLDDPQHTECGEHGGAHCGDSATCWSGGERSWGRQRQRRPWGGAVSEELHESVHDGWMDGWMLVSMYVCMI